MTGFLLSMALFVIIVSGAIGVPFAAVGAARIKAGRTRLGRLLIFWGVAVVLVPLLATSAAYAFLPREPGWDGHEAYPAWPFVFILTTFFMSGGSFIWFLGWLLGRGATPDAQSPE